MSFQAGGVSRREAQVHGLGVGVWRDLAQPVGALVIDVEAQPVVQRRQDHFPRFFACAALAENAGDLGDRHRDPAVIAGLVDSHGNEAFPSLEIVLQGYGVTIDLVGTTFISKTGVTSTTFKTAPDQPFSSFELTLPEGPYSALAANG
jgi:hypothetical protein